MEISTRRSKPSLRITPTLLKATRWLRREGIGVVMAVKKGANLNIYNKQGPQVTQTQQPQASPIQNSSDLNVTSADLDNTDLDGIDAELNQIDADASTF